MRYLLIFLVLVTFSNLSIAQDQDRPAHGEGSVNLTAKPTTVPIATSEQLPTSQGTKTPLEAFIDLVTQKNWPTARVIRKNLAEHYQDNAQFSYFSGIIFEYDKDYPSAIAAFTQALAINPYYHEARLALSRTYLLNNDIDNALVTIDQVAFFEPPKTVQQDADDFLKSIEELRNARSMQSNLLLHLGYGWTNNTDIDPTIAQSLLGPIINNPIESPQDSSYFLTSIGNSWRVPNSLTSYDQYTLAIKNKAFTKEAAQDLTVIDGRMLSFRQYAQRRYFLPLAASWTWKDHQPWQVDIEAALGQQQNFWGPIWAGFNAGSNISIATNTDNYTVTQLFATLNTDITEQQRHHNFQISYITNMIAGEDNKHQQWQGVITQYALTWQLTSNFSIGTSIEQQFQYHPKQDPTYGDKRQDQLTGIDLSAQWQVGSHIQLKTLLDWQWNNSNIADYESSDFEITQSVKFSF